jgi:hypothetical protein
VLLPFAMLTPLGCLATTRADSPAPKRIGWVLVTQSYEDSGHAGVARVAAGAARIVIEPVWERSAACPHVLRILGNHRASVRAGEVAEVEIGFEGVVRESHVLEVCPIERGTVLLTPAVMTVAPGSTARVRVTAATSGNCDIVIRVRECNRVK